MGLGAEITQINQVDYHLALRVPRHQIEARIRAELTVLGKKFKTKGFRQGKVPFEILRKKFGVKVTRNVCRDVITEESRRVLNSRDDLEIVGGPRVVEQKFALEGGDDLRALVQFAVEPPFELSSGSVGPVTRFVKSFSESDIDAEIEARLHAKASFSEAKETDVVSENDRVTVDLVPLNAKGVPAGAWQHGAKLLLGDSRLPEDLRTSLLSRKLGEVYATSISASGADGVYQIVIRAIEKWELPALSVLLGASSEADYRETVLQELKQSWARRSDAALRKKMVDKFVKLHDFLLPEALFEEKLDHLVGEEIRRWQGDDEFDEEAARKRNREKAEQMARWQIVKRRLVREEKLQATSKDLENEYRKIAGPDATKEEAEGDFDRQPEFRRRVAETVEERRVLAAIQSRFEIVEKNRDDVFRSSNR